MKEISFQHSNCLTTEVNTFIEAFQDIVFILYYAASLIRLIS